MLGTAGLPHVLMRFFTGGNAKEARKSVAYATGFIGYFYLLIAVVGLGGIIYLMDPNINSAYLDAAGKLIGGNNMAAVHLAHATGGSIFFRTCFNAWNCWITSYSYEILYSWKCKRG